MRDASTAARTKARQTGFTLVELMVGVALGMLTAVVIGQVLVHSDSQRRNVAMGGDADVNGSLALYSLQRDIQLAGYGIAANPSALGCWLQSQNAGTARTPFLLAPVVINYDATTASPHTADTPDSITVLMGNPDGLSAPMTVTVDKPYYFKVTSTLGVHAGDTFIAVPETWTSPIVGSSGLPSVALDTTNSCQLFASTNNTASADTTLDSTNLPHTTASNWNAALAASATGTGYGANSFLLNVGTLSRRTYSISSSYNLQLQERTSTDGLSAAAQDIFPQIVNMRALYGKDTNGDGTVDRYDNVTPTNNAGWRQVISIRIALVARNNHYEKEEVTTSEPLWDLGKATTVSGEATLADCNSTSQCITLKISGLPDWKHYRYKVYSTTVPLRNVLWNS